MHKVLGTMAEQSPHKLFLSFDATNAFNHWLVSMRDHPLFADMPYQLVFMLVTDNDGSWSEENEEWQRMIASHHICMRYVSPDRHQDENGAGERACGIIEPGVKSMLFYRNLPPSWWQRCSNALVYRLKGSKSN